MPEHEELTTRLISTATEYMESGTEQDLAEYVKAEEEVLKTINPNEGFNDALNLLEKAILIIRPDTGLPVGNKTITQPAERAAAVVTQSQDDSLVKQYDSGISDKNKRINIARKLCKNNLAIFIAGHDGAQSQINNPEDLGNFMELVSRRRTSTQGL